jgi:hypothetical protein
MTTLYKAAIALVASYSMKYGGALGLAAAGLLGCSGDVSGVGGNGNGGQGGTAGTSAMTTGTGASTTSTSTTGTTSTGTSTTGTGTTTSTGTGTSTTGTGMGCGMCDPAYFACCGAVCANLQNDHLNCGACGKVCPGPTPYCSGGVCGKPPCSIANGCSGGATCCDSVCCNSGELCCDVQLGGPVSGPSCQKPTNEGSCPLGCPGCVCASPDTPIATPDGERPIASLRQGDLVYSVHQGRVVAVPIRLTTSVPATNHVVVRVTLAGGRVLEISPKHPTAEGRPFGELQAGGALDGIAIHSVRAIPYAHDRTYDILPDSDTGTYFAGGALIGSTLAPGAATVRAPTAPLTPAE